MLVAHCLCIQLFITAEGGNDDTCVYLPRYALQAEGSALAARFSGQWEQCLDHDDQGRIFLDFDPEVFQQILAYLRSRAIFSSPGERPSLPQVEADKQTAYMDLVKYLVLVEFMGYSSDSDTGQPLKFSSASSGVQIDHWHQRAVVSKWRQSQFCTIIIEPFVQSCCCLKLKVGRVEQWMFAGIATDIPANYNQNYSLPTAHGWDDGNTQWVCGAPRHPGPSVLFGTGDTILMMANLEGKQLFLKSTRSTMHACIPLQVPIEQQNRFAFYIMLYLAGDEVELLPVTAEDRQSLS